MARPAGFIIDVPVTLSVAVRGDGLTAKAAKQIARNFADAIAPTEYFVQGYSDTLFKLTYRTITEVSLESSTEETCEVLEELEAEEDFTPEARTRIGNTPDPDEDEEDGDGN